jgi:radical SAM enzyme (TIGR01210 family)
MVGCGLARHLFRRLRRIRKGFTLRGFEEAARIIAAAGLGLYAYLLLKPLGTGEQEALEDVLQSGRYLCDLSTRLGLPVRVALEPVFVPEGTELHAELRAGRYRPPSLWTVLEASAGLLALGLQVQVGLSEEGLPASQRPASCLKCGPALRAALARFNQTQDPAALNVPHCDCRAPTDRTK